MVIEWREIPGVDGYKANSLGEIWSEDRDVVKQNKGTEYVARLKGKRLSPWMAGPYHYCCLGRSGPKTSVHRLVCAAFHGPPQPGQEVAHLDGDCLNNAPGNLRWVTHAENEQHKIAHGTYGRPRNFKKPWHQKRGTKPTRHPQADAIIRMRSEGASIADVAAALGMSKSGAANVIKNRL